MSVESRPVAAFILSIIGGVFILTAGILSSVIGAALTFFMLGIGAIFGIVGVLCGIPIIICSAIMYAQPQHHHVCSALIIMASIFSLLSATRGFFIGFPLSLITETKGERFPFPRFFTLSDKGTEVAKHLVEIERLLKE